MTRPGRSMTGRGPSLPQYCGLHTPPWASQVFSSMYSIRSRKLQPCTSQDRLRSRARAAGASRPMKSSSDSPAHPRIPADPEEQWSSLCHVGSCLASQNALQNVPRDMGCWHRTGARQPSWHLGGQPSVDAWFQPTRTQHFITWTRSHPQPLLPSLPPDLSACRQLMDWSRQSTLGHRYQDPWVSKFSGMWLQKIKERLLLGLNNPIILIFPIFLWLGTKKNSI